MLDETLSASLNDSGRFSFLVGDLVGSRSFGRKEDRDLDVRRWRTASTIEPSWARGGGGGIGREGESWIVTGIGGLPASRFSTVVATLRHTSSLMPTVRWCLASSPLAQGLVHCRLACKLHRLPCTLHRLPYTLYRPHITIHTQSRRAAAPSLCPSCSKPLPSFLHACTACWNISSSSSNMTHHDLFGLPYEPNPFVVDLTTLKQRFRQAQAVCHPDAWTSKGSVCT